MTSAIYNEVLQFFLIVAGFLPLVWVGLKNVGGWTGLKAQLPGDAYSHAWRGMTNAHSNPLGVEWFGLAMGLGFVLSFGYWCTDFLVIQTAMATDSEENARRVPLIAAIPKMFFPFLVILPGLIAIATPSVMPQAQMQTAAASVPGSAASRVAADQVTTEMTAGPDPGQARSGERQGSDRRRRQAVAGLRPCHPQHAVALFSRPASWAWA